MANRNVEDDGMHISASKFRHQKRHIARKLQVDQLVGQSLAISNQQFCERLKFLEKENLRLSAAIKELSRGCEGHFAALSRVELRVEEVSNQLQCRSVEIESDKDHKLLEDIQIDIDDLSDKIKLLESKGSAEVLIEALRSYGCPGRDDLSFICESLKTQQGRCDKLEALVVKPHTHAVFSSSGLDGSSACSNSLLTSVPVVGTSPPINITGSSLGSDEPSAVRQSKKARLGDHCCLCKKVFSEEGDLLFISLDGGFFKSRYQAIPQVLSDKWQRFCFSCG